MAPAADHVPRRSIRTLLASREVRFLIVGGVNFVMAIALFVAFHALLGDATSYLVALILTYVVGIVIAFTLQRIFVFRVSGTVVADFVRFTGVQVVGFGINAVMLALFVEVAHLPVQVAQLVALAVLTVVMYFGHSLISFRRTDDAA